MNVYPLSEFSQPCEQNAKILPALLSLAHYSSLLSARSINTAQPPPVHAVAYEEYSAEDTFGTIAGALKGLIASADGVFSRIESRVSEFRLFPAHADPSLPPWLRVAS